MDSANPATSPPAVYFSSMAYDAALGEVVLYTSDDNGGQNETWTYNGATLDSAIPGRQPWRRQRPVDGL